MGLLLIAFGFIVVSFVLIVIAGLLWRYFQWLVGDFLVNLIITAIVLIIIFVVVSILVFVVHHIIWPLLCWLWKVIPLLAKGYWQLLIN